MPFEWLKSLRGAKDQRAALVAKLGKLGQQRTELLARGPDRAAVIAWFTRSIEAECSEYTARLGRWFFGAAAKAAVGGAFFDTDASVSLLCVPRESPFHTVTLAPNPSLAAPSPLALAFFLRKAMLEEVPRLVDKHFPEAATGISTADRDAALAKIDSAIAATTAELAEIDAAVEEVRKAAAA